MTKKTIVKTMWSGQHMDLKSKSKCFLSPAIDFGVLRNTYNQAQYDILQVRFHFC